VTVHWFTVASDTGIEAKPCSLCTGKLGDSFIKPSATSNSTEMLDSSHGYGIGEWRKQTVSTLLFSLPGFFFYSVGLYIFSVERHSVISSCVTVFCCSSEIRKITSHIQTGMSQHIYTE